MTQPADRDIASEAIAWRIRLHNGRFEDWDAFMDWLEGDPERSAAYDAAALADAALAPGAIPDSPVRSAANDGSDRPFDEGGSRSYVRWATALAALAASILIGLVVIPWLTAVPDRYEIATGPGQRRTVALGDGSSVELNGRTRLVLTRDNPRFAELATGEAAFSVRHDASRPFVVTVGGHRLQDAGTAFNVVRERNRFSIEVIEGAVLYNPGSASIHLTAGQTLSARDGGRPSLGRRDPRTMAGWRRGQLSYSAAPLESVAADLTRNIGADVTVDPAIRALPFTGSISVDQDAAATVTGFASTLGLRARPTGHGWLIEPNARAPR